MTNVNGANLLYGPSSFNKSIPLERAGSITEGIEDGEES